MRKKVIVTGGAGFIGSHLVDELVKLGYSVIVIDNLSTGAKENLRQSWDKIDFIEYDLSTGFPDYLKDVDYIFHLAAFPNVQRSIEDPLEVYKSNVDVLMNTLEMARELEIKKFIFASSCAVTGDPPKMPINEDISFNPQTPYAYYKMIGEQLCRMYQNVFDLPCIVFRFFNVYGPRMAKEGAYKLVLSVWMEQIENNQPLTITGDGTQTRDFVFVTDIAKGLIIGAESKEIKDFEVINLGSGKEVSILDLAKMLNHPYQFIEKRQEDKRKQADITKAKKFLNWEPQMSIEEGMEMVKKKNQIK